MKRIITGINGGMPHTLNDLKFIQDATEEVIRGFLLAFNIQSNEKVILVGMEFISGTPTDPVFSEGYVAINGEVLYHPETLYGPLVPPGNDFAWIVAQDNFLPEGDKNFETSGLQSTYRDRVAVFQFGAALPGGETNWLDLPKLHERLGTVPSKAIMMWSGSIADIPTGWALCDGSVGTPDLRGRFVVGVDPGDPSYDSLTQVGGNKEHLHTFAAFNAAPGATPTAGAINTTEHLPPYMALYYIMRL